MQSPLPAETYQKQVVSWPSTGQHILAHFDDETIVVYDNGVIAQETTEKRNRSTRILFDTTPSDPTSSIAPV